MLAGLDDNVDVVMFAASDNVVELALRDDFNDIEGVWVIINVVGLLLFIAVVVVVFALDTDRV